MYVRCKTAGCCHSVLQLDQSYFIFVSTFSLPTLLVFLLLVLLFLIMFSFLFFLRYYQFRLVPSIFPFHSLHFHFYLLYKSFWSYFFSTYLLTYFFSIPNQMFPLFINYFIILYLLYLHKIIIDSLENECVSRYFFILFSFHMFSFIFPSIIFFSHLSYFFFYFPFPFLFLVFSLYFSWCFQINLLA